jgi:hypothetical protein
MSRSFSSDSSFENGINKEQSMRKYFSQNILGLLAVFFTSQVLADEPCGPNDEKTSFGPCTLDKIRDCSNWDFAAGLCDPLSVTVEIGDVTKCTAGRFGLCLASKCVDEYKSVPADPIGSVIGGYFNLVPVLQFCADTRRCQRDPFDAFKCIKSTVTNRVNIPRKIVICCTVVS